MSDTIRNLRKAQYLAAENGNHPQEGSWLSFEVPRQLGILNYRLSQLPGISRRKHLEFLEGAISNTRLVLENPIPEHDPRGFIRFTVLKAKGNLIYLLAKRIQTRSEEPDDKDTIAQNISELQAEEYRELVENQVHIIDSISCAAAIIGDNELASREARKNLENFRSISVNRNLVAEEMEMLGRAEEIVFFCEKNSKPAKRRFWSRGRG